jgi:hypothetical protein
MAKSALTSRIDAAKKAALQLLGSSVADDADRSRAKLSSLRAAVDKVEKSHPPEQGDAEYDLGLFMAQKIAFSDLSYYLYVLEEDREHWILFAVETLCDCLDLMKCRAVGGETAEEFAANLSRIMQIRYYHVESMLFGAGRLTPQGMTTMARSMKILQEFKKDDDHGCNDQGEVG